MTKLLAHSSKRSKAYNKKDRNKSKDKCVFCTPEVLAKDQILSRKHWVVFANHYPFLDWAILIVPKRHIEYLHETYDEEWKELNRILSQLDLAWSKYYREEYNHSKTELYLDQGEPSFNITLNNGEHSGQTVRHLHWHFIPRVYRRDTGMEHISGFHKVKVTPEETAALFRRLLRVDN